ncbi:MAG: translation elongation factor Ts [Marinomonas foliarum]|uniref:Elongation factor Ts n=1 Tax=Marinomonas polaris DSM 16579 TaxID=1122206 RepID=A0A1M5C4L0_9GAMM|nr:MULTISPECIES: translation elongation factor Ts [Marinomonas]MBU1294521.1 translation elongation factor Ts [Gammaproteobacteria bacterium]MBU1465168.1 translation elongation factor Ts [Gammaproteobacteria bacterium]MBU2021985.1 translation elongation factor Ts [Gammaproteobacteria bacterium]MBU2236797.1 translation elongation factor Ts [Gammaproteobacteria bacterium]MBU2319573.1 translation elongation factor Ts [Gammaproteobacteria bacterium]|tara:strand:+ start:191340 stop:192200 length:861 start_codon:yes stop_codon:yes gene_type:complete
MAAVSAALVKELRERTGLGMMECKKALVAANADIEVAIEELRKSSGMKAAKKAGRTAAEGTMVMRVADDSSYAILVEVNSETDFASRDEGFIAFANKVADVVFTTKETDIEVLLAGEIGQAREALVQKIGENISPRRAVIIEGGLVGGYLHGNGQIAVLTQLEGGSAELAKDVSMHVAAVSPRVVRGEDMPAEVLAKEEEIIRAQPDMAGKPAEIVDKMIVGRMKKFLAENSLTEQPFVKNPEIKVGQLVKDAGATVTSFIRLEVGEGIEVAEVDFAAEVAAQLRG